MCAVSTGKLMSVATIIESVVPSTVTIESVYPIPSSGAQRRYEARLSDGSSLLLCMPLPPAAKLLRFERACVGAEATILAWVSSLDPPSPPRSPGTPMPEGDQKFPQGEVASTTIAGCSTERVIAQDLVPYIPPIPSSLIPALLGHSSPHTFYEPGFTIVKPTGGSRIASLKPPLSPIERKSVSFQYGRLLRQLSEIHSPSGRFGPVANVLGGSPGLATRKQNTARYETKGSTTWAIAFASLLEGILRDGEDMHITLPYSSIRRQFERLEHTLDDVTKPGLVIIGNTDEENIVVARRRRSTEPESPPAQPHFEAGDGEETHVHDGKMKKSTEMITPRASVEGDEGVDIAVTSLLDWSSCVFGDPLLANAFYGENRDGLWEGFAGFAELGDRNSDEFAVVRGEKNTASRMLLYECYHAVTRVVREFYRPTKDSGRRELEARKALNTALAKLSRVTEAVGSRRRRLSGEVSPAKRYKPESHSSDEAKPSGKEVTA